VKEPAKNLPRAILITLLITTLFYVAVSFAVIALADPHLLANSRFPLAQALSKVAPKMEKILSGIALFSTANTVLITLLVGSRMLFSVAREGDLPEFLSKTHTDYSSPHRASFVILLISCSLLFVGNLEILASLSSFVALVGFLVVNFTVIRLRYIEPNLLRPFKIPLNICHFPILSGLGVVLTFFMCLQFTRIIYGISGILILISAFSYFYKKSKAYKI
jgi:amino acid transporter